MHDDCTNWIKKERRGLAKLIGGPCLAISGCLELKQFLLNDAQPSLQTVVVVICSFTTNESSSEGMKTMTAFLTTLLSCNGDSF